MGILTKIRQRPENEKRIFSFVSAGVLTVIIFIVWLSFTSDPSNSGVASENKLSSISPVEVFKEQFSKAFSDFNESTGEYMSSTSSSTVSIEIIDATSTATSTITSTTSVTSSNNQ
jgi:hypothetical protein